MHGCIKLRVERLECFVLGCCLCVHAIAQHAWVMKSRAVTVAVRMWQRAEASAAAVAGYVHLYAGVMALQRLKLESVVKQPCTPAMRMFSRPL